MRALVVLLLMLISVFGAELKIATFNVENLFDGRNDGTEYRDFQIGKSSWSNARYIKKNSEVSEFLKSVNADIVALQEIENEEVIKRLASSSEYKYYKFTKDRSSPFGVGVMSRYPIKSASYYRFKDFRTRDILRVDYELGEYKFSVFTLHFLSQKNQKSDRLTEFKELVKFTSSAKNAIILGDFNEDYSATSMLKPLEDRYRNLWKEKFGFERRSHVSGRAIDHILLDKSFFDDSSRLYYKSFRVINSAKLSDHDLLLLTLSTKAPQISTKSVSNLEDIYKFGKISKPLSLQGVSITYKDKFGYTITQEGGRGIYVYDRESKFEIGDKLDVTINSVGVFKDNLEVKDLKVDKIYQEKVDLNLYTKKSIKDLRAGDTLRSISGKVINGRLYYGEGNIPVYSKNRGKIGDSIKEMTFENAYAINFRGELELLVR